MAISIRCDCGRLLDVDERFRGQPVQCPHCHAVVQTPAGMASSSPVNKAEQAKARDQEMISKIVVACILCVVGLILICYDIGFGKLLLLAALGGAAAMKR